jgi:inner membrane protein
MASAFSHAVVAAAIGTAFAPPRSLRFWVYGTLCSVIPDVDVTGFALDVNYEDMLGHRGLTHSIAFAAALSAVATSMIRRKEQTQPWRILWLYIFLATASHGVLDAFTNGGLGVAFFAPFVNTRFFFPFQPIEVSPIGLTSFFSARGLTVITNEVMWIWLPACLFAVAMLLVRRTPTQNSRT